MQQVKLPFKKEYFLDCIRKENSFYLYYNPFL